MARKTEKESRFAKLADRLARSSRVFMLGVIVACGVEVLVDWNATLFEINVLRDRMRERGFNYVGILVEATDSALAAGDTAALEKLTEGVFADEDVALVRFARPDGSIVWEKANGTFETAFQAERGKTPRDYYASQLTRDVRDLLRDPELLKKNLAESRYRDFAQRWSDAMNKLVVRFAGPPKPRPGVMVIYQDRLRTLDRKADDAVTYALAQVPGKSGPAGALIVAFSMERTNAAIRTKYLKGFGMVVFFVGLILVQNVMSRRDKLRLLDLEARYAAAKKALREAFGKPHLEGPLHVAAAIDQAPGAVDGMCWDVEVHEGSVTLAVIDPDGDGIDAAAVALHALKALRASHDTPLEEARRVGASILDIPLTRPLGILLLRVDADGTIDGVASPFAALRLQEGTATREIERSALDDQEGLVGPLFRLSGRLPAGARLIGAFGHVGNRRGRPLDIEEVAAFLGRARETSLDHEIEDAVTWARGRATALADHDLAIVAIERASTA